MLNLVDRLVIRRYLRQQADSTTLAADKRAAIRQILSRPLKMIQLNNSVDTMAAAALPQTTLASLEAGELTGPIMDILLQFLKDHWDEILALILQLLGL